MVPLAANKLSKLSKLSKLGFLNRTWQHLSKPKAGHYINFYHQKKVYNNFVD